MQIMLEIPMQDGEDYPGDIAPGRYTRNDVVKLLREHCHDPEAVRFIADMLEE
jgi:hypothetical protein